MSNIKHIKIMKLKSDDFKYFGIRVKYKEDEIIVTSTYKDIETNYYWYKENGFIKEHMYALTYMLAVAKFGFDKKIKVHLVTKFESPANYRELRTAFDVWYDNILKLYDEGKLPYHEDRLKELLEQFKVESPFVKEYTEENISKINKLLHDTQCSIVSKYCYNKDTQEFSDVAHVSAIYEGITTFIKEFKRLGYTDKMISDWVDKY